MKKIDIANQVIGLFFSQENKEQRSKLAEAFETEGAIVRTIKDEKELELIMADEGPGRPRAIIFDSTVFPIKTAEALVDAKIEPVCVTMLPKGARVIPGESREIGTFVQNVLNKEMQPVG